MKLTRSVLMMFASGIVTVSLSAADQSFTGTVSDSHCGAKHAMKNLSAEACTKACVKSGADYALVVGEKVYTLKGDKGEVDKFAGKMATVTGNASGNMITVASISEPKK